MGTSDGAVAGDVQHGPRPRGGTGGPDTRHAWSRRSAAALDACFCGTVRRAAGSVGHRTPKGSHGEHQRSERPPGQVDRQGRTDRHGGDEHRVVRLLHLRNCGGAGVSKGVFLRRIVANGGADCVLQHVRRWLSLASDGRGDLWALRRPRWPEGRARHRASDDGPSHDADRPPPILCGRGSGGAGDARHPALRTGTRDRRPVGGSGAARYRERATQQARLLRILRADRCSCRRHLGQPRLPHRQHQRVARGFHVLGVAHSLLAEHRPDRRRFIRSDQA